LGRVGKHREVAQNDHVGVRYRGAERVDEADGLRDRVTTGRQRVTVTLPGLAIVRDQEDARYAVE
jgi:hypothetical protein